MLTLPVSYITYIKSKQVRYLMVRWRRFCRSLRRRQFWQQNATTLTVRCCRCPTRLIALYSVS